jgi:formylmethanofuran dehydrogenase subunit E
MDTYPDNYNAYDDYEREQEHEEQEYLESLPDCEWCGKPIKDELYYDLGEIVCEACIDKCRKFVG